MRARRSASSFLFAATLACTVPVSSIAAAQGGDPSKLALAAGYEADRLFAAGKWTEAYEKFKEADRLAHSPVFVLYMARARRNEGKLVEASEIYATVANEKVDAKAPKPFLSAVKDAAAELEELRARIPAARVEVKGAGARDLLVTIDGKPARPGARILLDPGPHDFVAKSKQRRVDKTVSLSEGGSETVVELAFEEDEKKVPAVKAKKQGGFIPGALLLAFGGAGVDLGIVTGVIATVQSSKIKEGCVETHCLTTDADALDRARLLGNVSTGALVAGGLVAATGVVLLVVRPGASPSEPRASIGPGFVSVSAPF